MLYVMHVLTVTITCTFLAELEVQESIFGSYMRNGVMDDPHGPYTMRKRSKFCMLAGSNGRRGSQEPVTMRSLHKEVRRLKS
jgi:hypothetical protein